MEYFLEAKYRIQCKFEEIKEKKDSHNRNLQKHYLIL